MPSLTLKAISKKFGRVMALSGVDLHVEDGEFCVLLGPSGCGKSTLLNIIAGLIPQDDGTVLLNGQSVDALAPRDRDIAMVFQNYALYPHMTVAQNMSFGLRMRRLPKATIKEYIREAAGLLGIEDLLDRKPRELSGGQQQRVAMGRALVRRPRLFLLDEPLSNLDARLRAKVRLELKRLHSQIKGTFIYVTHDQVEAMTLADRVVVMCNGEVRQIGTPEAVYSYPEDTFVATFIGSPEINLYRGTLVHKDGRAYFQGAGFSFDIGRAQPDLSTVEVEVGIRCDDIKISKKEITGLKAKVEMTSNVGAEQYVHARLGQEELTLRAPKDLTLQPGSLVHLTIDGNLVHVFHQGRRVS